MGKFRTSPHFYEGVNSEENALGKGGMINMHSIGESMNTDVSMRREQEDVAGNQDDIINK